MIFLTVVPIGLFVGVVVYGIHRSIIYPIVESFFDSNYGRLWRRGMPLISLASIQTILWRWRINKDKDVVDLNQVNKNLNRWANYIHMQFTSSLCTILGIVVGLLLNHCRHPSIWLLIFISFILFIAALISDWRLHSVMDHLRE